MFCRTLDSDARRFNGIAAHRAASDESATMTRQELTRNSDQLRLLIQVAEAIATHRDLTALCRDLAKRLPTIVPFEFIALFLHDQEKGVMRVDMLGTADADSIPPGLEVPVDGSFSGLVFSTQRPIIVNDQHEAARFPATISLMQRTGAESFCMIPLTTTVRRLGAMAFGSCKTQAFDESELEFLQLVVSQIAVAVDNVLHEESARTVQTQLSQERDRLRLLLEVSESIASHRNLNDLFKDFSERLPRVVPFDYINLLLHDPARDVMRLHILVAPEESTIRPGMEFPVNESASGLAWQTQRPLTVEDVDTETRFPRLIAMMRENGVRSFCAVPLTTALRRLGSLGFGSLTYRVYTESDLNFMQQVANQVAVAVDNVLHDETARSTQEQLTRDRDRLQLLLEVNNAVVSHLDLDQCSGLSAHVCAALFRTTVPACCSVSPKPDSSGFTCCASPQRQLRRGRTRRGWMLHVSGRCRDQHQADGALRRSRAHGAGGGIQGSPTNPRRGSAVVLLRSTAVARSRHGTLNVGSSRPSAFSQDDVELLGQVAQQIAIAVENGLAYRQIAELKEKLNTEKSYLEEEIRTEQNFEEIVGTSDALEAGARADFDRRSDGLNGPDSG